MAGLLANSVTPPPGSWLHSWRHRRRRHPQSFGCGVRVVRGAVVGERARWRHRDSALDPHPTHGRIVLHHGGTVTLELDAVAPAPGVRTRPGHVVLRATVLGNEAGPGAIVELSVPLGLVEDFGVETW